MNYHPIHGHNLLRNSRFCRDVSDSYDVSFHLEIVHATSTETQLESVTSFTLWQLVADGATSFKSFESPISEGDHTHHRRGESETTEPAVTKLRLGAGLVPTPIMPHLDANSSSTSTWTSRLSAISQATTGGWKMVPMNQGSPSESPQISFATSPALFRCAVSLIVALYVVNWAQSRRSSRWRSWASSYTCSEDPCLCFCSCPSQYFLFVPFELHVDSTDSTFEIEKNMCECVGSAI